VAKNIVRICTNDSLRRLEVTYEDSSTKECSTYFLEATRPGYYDAARYVARRQVRTRKPVPTKSIIAFVDRQKRKYETYSKSQLRNRGIATSSSTFYSWWGEGDFVDPAMGLWTVTDASGKKLEKTTAGSMLEDVFQKQTSATGNKYWLGNIARVEIIVGGEGVEGIGIRPPVANSSPDLASHTRRLPDTQRIRDQPVEAQEPVSTDLLGYLGMMEEELSRNRLLEQFGRNLEDLRIPLRVVPYEPVRDLADIRAREHSRQTGSPDDTVGRKGEILRRNRRAYAFRGTVQEDREGSRLHPENLAALEPKLQTAILLGDPGSGKTEWLRYQARQAARKARDGLTAAALRPADVVFPAFVRLDEVSISLQDQNGLQDFLFQTGCCPSRPVLNDEQQLAAAMLMALVKHHHLSQRLTGWVWHKLTAERSASTSTDQSASSQGNPPLLCLDAWDEVRHGHDRLAQCLGAFGKKTSARIFITSRVIGYSRRLLPLDIEPRSEQSEFRICPFEPTETETFVTAFFRDDPPCAKKMIEELHDKVAVQDMARNPLLVTLLCMAFSPSPERQPLAFPARRVEIYERVLMGLLGKWKRVGKKKGVSVGLIKAKLRLLEEMAFRFFPEEILSEDNLHDFLWDEKHGYMTRVPEGHPFRQLLSTAPQKIGAENHAAKLAWHLAITLAADFADQLNGCACRFQWATYAINRSPSVALSAKSAIRSRLRARMLNHCSTWFIHEQWTGG